jgi:hypothetical protein
MTLLSDENHPVVLFASFTSAKQEVSFVVNNLLFMPLSVNILRGKQRSLWHIEPAFVIHLSYAH